MIALSLFLVLAAPAPEAKPLLGDVVHGEALLKKAGGKIKVDGAWINAAPDVQILEKLENGTDDFPRIASENVLDRWDVLAFLRSRNTDMGELLMGADSVLVTHGTLDENAEARLKDKAKVTSGIESDRRVFALFKTGAAPGISYIGEKDNRRRDKLKKNTKTGYVVFVKLPGFRTGDYEAAFAVDKDVHIQNVVVRGPDGIAAPELNQAAARFVGKGARGQYVQLKASGAGKSIGELEKPISDAYLMAMEAVYMFEVQERDYFAFDD